MKKTILFLGVIISLFGCNKNSEQELLNKIKEVTKLQAIARDMSAAENKSLDSTLLYVAKIQNIIDRYEKLPDTFLIENLFRKGYYYKRVGVIDSATIYFHRAIDLVKKPNNRKRNITYFRNAWTYDQENKQYANGITIAQKFIDISNIKRDSGDLLYAYNFLEQVYLILENYEKSLEYNSKVLEAAKQSSNIDMYVITANSKAKTLYSYLDREKEAFNLLDSLNTIKCGKNAKRQLYRTHGTLNYYHKNYRESVKYNKKALHLSKEMAKNSKDYVYHNYNLLESYNNITDAYLELEEYEIAKKYLDSTKSIINSNSATEHVLYYDELRFKLNFRTKAKEYDVFNEYNKLKFENNKQHENKINEKLNALTVANKKEKLFIAEKNEADLKSIKLIALSVFLGLLTILGYLFYRQRRFKFEKQELQMQQRLLRSQMNPHFTFNTLSAIQNQIKENQEGAANYLLKFSRLLRLILENSLNNYVQIEKELESLRKYIDLQLLRFPTKFNYDIILENFEEEEFLFIPPMLMQPFIENSIEHGFLGIDYKGHITIKLKLQDKFIACTIEDNGVGIIASNTNYKKSVSTKLISQFINKTTKRNVVILDKKNEDITNSGVLVKFLIPYKFSEND